MLCLSSPLYLPCFDASRRCSILESAAAWASEFIDMSQPAGGLVAHYRPIHRSSRNPADNCHERHRVAPPGQQTLEEIEIIYVIEWTQPVTR
jgi:hypothetical protein